VDIYELLNQRERDLTLAAEIGQALLEKNEQLSKQNEEIAEEFSKKLEVSAALLASRMIFHAPRYPSCFFCDP